MNLQLAAISAKVAPGRHAALLLDQAGWHTTPQLTVPVNISIVPLPAKCPELNAQENVWQFLRENWLSNRIFTCYDNLVDHCCHAWNKLVAQPWTVMSGSVCAIGHTGSYQRNPGITRARGTRYRKGLLASKSALR